MDNFHHEMLPTSFKELFQKTAEVHYHNTRYATNQNYFIQVSTNAGKKTIFHQGATLWANIDQQFKDKSHNAFSNQYRSCLLLLYGWMSEKLYYWIHLVKFSIKILSLHLSYYLRIRLACVSDCSYGLWHGAWHFVVGNWSISMILISGLFRCYTQLCLCIHF